MMRRRFLTSLPASAAVFGTILSTQESARGGNVNAKFRTSESQSEDGVVTHPFDTELMKGNPPSPENRVRAESVYTSQRHRAWAHQHMREFCGTQNIPRGKTELAVLPRATKRIDGMLVPFGKDKEIPLREFLRQSFTDAFLVLHKGQIITEQYFSGMKPSTLHHLWSASKSISTGVLFNLLSEGMLKEDTLITDHIPELTNSGYEGATVRHLMDMQSGVKYEYGKDIKLDTSNTEGGQHFRAAGFFPRLPGEDPNLGQCAFFPKLKKAREHGSVFYYKCTDTAVLGWVCERATKERFANLISHYIWSRLGAEHDAYIICDVDGMTSPNAGMSVTLRDFARWGQLHLHNGRWLGEQIIPKACLDDVRENHDHTKIKSDSFLSKDDLIPKTAYRSQYWIAGEQGAYYAGGAFGQLCYIDPAHDVVIARFASEWEVPDVNWGKIVFPAFAKIGQSIAT